MATKRRPSAVWYWVGGGVAALCLVAAVAGVLAAVFGFFGRIDDFQRVPVPGEGTVTFSGTGGYTLYYEAPGASEGPLPPVQVTLAPVAGGEPVALEDYDSDLTYDYNGHDGRAVATFRIDDPGAYRLVATYDGPGRGEVAVGRSLTRGIAGRILGSVLLAILGLAFGTLVITLTAVKRHQAPARPPNR